MTDECFVLCWLATGLFLCGAGGVALYYGVDEEIVGSPMVIGGFMVASTVVLSLLVF